MRRLRKTLLQRQKTVNRPVKWCWTLVIIRKMRVKPAVRFRLTPVRTAIVTESTGNKGWRGCGEKGTLLHCWRECILVQPRWRNVWRLFKNLKLELPYDPEIPLQGVYPEKTTVWKDPRTLMFIAALCTTAKTWKQPTCPSIDEQIKRWYKYPMDY